jgi:hypothetical protein
MIQSVPDYRVAPYIENCSTVGPTIEPRLAILFGVELIKASPCDDSSVRPFGSYHKSHGIRLGVIFKWTFHNCVF